MHCVHGIKSIGSNSAEGITNTFQIILLRAWHENLLLQANKQNGHKPQHEADHKAESKPEPAGKKEVHVGSSIGMSGRNPLDLIKTNAPLLSEAKTSKSKRALAPLLDAAGRDEACVWYRVSSRPRC